MTLYCRNISQCQKERSCLEKGIVDASPTLITRYGNNRSLSEYNTLYLTGRVWLATADNSRIFSHLVEDWYDNTDDDAIYHSKGFIIGQIVNRLPAGLVTKPRFESPRRREAFIIARDIYIQMCDKTAQAIYAWMLTGKQLAIMRDIRMLIAREIWMTRDQALWA